MSLEYTVKLLRNLIVGTSQVKYISHTRILCYKTPPPQWIHHIAHRHHISLENFLPKSWKEVFLMMEYTHTQSEHMKWGWREWKKNYAEKRILIHSFVRARHKEKNTAHSHKFISQTIYAIHIQHWHIHESTQYEMKQQQQQQQTVERACDVRGCSKHQREWLYTSCASLCNGAWTS